MKTANPVYLNYDGPAFHGDVKVTIMLITPDLAKEMLSKNRLNRKISSHTVNKYIADMTSKDWQALNGQTISFYEDGGLKDGQHRLTAIVKSNIPQWCIVVEGISTDEVIADIGKPRTLSNIMEMGGYNVSIRSQTSVSTVSFLFLLGTRDNSVSYPKRIAFAEKYEDLIVTCVRASNAGGVDGKSRMRKSSVIAALVCAFYCGVSQELILNFCRSVNSGLYNGEEETSTVFLARAIDTPRYYGIKERELLFDITLTALDDYINLRPRKKPYGAVTQHRWKKQALLKFFPDSYNPYSPKQ